MTLNSSFLESPNTLISIEAPEDESDEDMCWEPLFAQSSGSISSSAASSFPTADGMHDCPILCGPSGHNSEPKRSEHPTEIPTTAANNSIKEKLMDHPINMFWSHFFIHLIEQLWGLDFRIRMGLTMVLTGLVLKCFVLLMSLLLWNRPKTIVLTILGLTSFLCLDPLDLVKVLKNFGRACSSLEAFVEFLEQLQPAKIRNLCLGLMMVPTLLEARTVAYLAFVQTEVRWTYTLLIFAMVTGLCTYLCRIQQCSPKECWQKGLFLLYGSATLITCIRLNVARLPLFAAPFCLTTGTILLTYRNDDMEWLSRSVRLALRLTLRDVLSEVSTNVQHDEMLRITMLRWIVDYWTGSSQHHAASTCGSHCTLTEVQTTATNPMMFQRPHGQNRLAPRHELQWDELCSMLNLTADQIQMEMPLSPMASPSSKNQSVDNIKAMLAAMDVDLHAKPAVMAYKRAVEAFPPSHQVAVFLAVFRRCPAFVAWLWIYSAASLFPWSVTLLLSPFVVLDFLRLQEWVASCQAASIVIAVGDATDDNFDEHAQTSFMGELDEMTIWLSGDHFAPDHPPVLLVVWNNVVNSVSALEMGLTAARCLQTTAVAAEFAKNMLSLAEFGAQVSQHGWLHGWTMLVQEWLQSTDEGRHKNPKYTPAAVNAIRQGNIVARNLRVLAEEEERNLTLGHLWQFLSVFLRYGLPGSQQKGRGNAGRASTVEITEIIDSDPHPTDSSQVAENGNILSNDEVALPTVEALSSAETFIRDSGNNSRDCRFPTEDFSSTLDLIASCLDPGLIDKGELTGASVGVADENITEGSDDKVKATLSELLRKSHGFSGSHEIALCSDTESLLGRGDSDQSVAHDGDLADSFVSTLLSKSQSFDEITSLPSYEVGAHANASNEKPVATAEIQDIPNAQPQKTVTVQQGNDDWLKWVGGGLAIVGTVVGGVVLANTLQGGAQSEPAQSEQRNDNTSSVQIELLDDGDDCGVNEWVSVSRS